MIYELENMVNTEMTMVQISLNNRFLFVEIVTMKKNNAGATYCAWNFAAKP